MCFSLKKVEFFSGNSVGSDSEYYLSRPFACADCRSSESLPGSTVLLRACLVAGPVAAAALLASLWRSNDASNAPTGKRRAVQHTL